MKKLLLTIMLPFASLPRRRGFVTFCCAVVILGALSARSADPGVGTVTGDGPGISQSAPVRGPALPNAPRESSRVTAAALERARRAGVLLRQFNNPQCGVC